MKKTVLGVDINDGLVVVATVEFSESKCVVKHIDRVNYKTESDIVVCLINALQRDDIDRIMVNSDWGFYVPTINELKRIFGEYRLRKCDIANKSTIELTADTRAIICCSIQ